MEKTMDNEMEALGPFKGVHRDITNQMEQNTENSMETGIMYMLRVYGCQGCLG